MKYRIRWTRPNGQQGFIMNTYQWVAGVLKFDTAEEAEATAVIWRKDQPTFTFTVEDCSHAVPHRPTHKS